MINDLKLKIWLPVLILIMTLSAPPTFGDTWGAPTKKHWSANKKWVLKVSYPDDKTLALCEVTEDGFQEHWRRGYVDRVWPPHVAYVTDDGQFVVLRDVYHNLGYEKDIVILGERGKTLGSYELNDFLPQDEIDQAERSVSSLWWNTYAWFSFINDDRQFALVTQVGTVRCFDLPSGQLLDLTADQRAEIVDRVRREAETWVESEVSGERSRGITLLGGMRIEAAIPTAMRLFQDKTRTGSVGRKGKPSAEIYSVQKAAALALTRLMGTEAIPIIEEELSEANWYMAKELLDILNRYDTKSRGFAGFYEIIETPESPSVLAMWKRLAKHASADVRNRALCEVLRRDDGTYLLDQPQLIQSESDSVRGAAVMVLAKVESPEALTLLRKAITDEQDGIRRSALSKFIARRPPDIEEVLLPYLQDQYAPIRLDVICELACWRNPAAIEKLRETIASWPDVEPDGEDKWFRRREIQLQPQYR
jgi:HEAT repeat protein